MANHREKVKLDINPWISKSAFGVISATIDDFQKTNRQTFCLKI